MAIQSTITRTVKRLVWAGALGALASIACGAEIPQTMQAIVQTGTGGPEVLKLEPVPVPQPAENQVLVRVYAAGINPVDWKMRRGMGPPPGVGARPPAGPPGAAPPPGGPPDPPAGPGAAPAGVQIPGGDMSGVIVAVGPGVTQWKVGDAVYGQGVNRRGGYAQYVVSDVADLAAKPARFSFAQAAGIPVVASAALRALDYANPMPGQTVVIVGAAGGVGSAAVQLVRARGAKVIAVASSEHNAFLKKLGADEIVNYDKEKPADKIKDADVVINLVDDQAAQAISYVKRGGSIVLLAGMLSQEQCAAVAANPCGMPGFTAGPNNAEAFAEINKLAAAGKFTIKVEKIFPLAQAGQAQEFNRSGHAEGKIILATQSAALANKR